MAFAITWALFAVVDQDLEGKLFMFHDRVTRHRDSDEESTGRGIFRLNFREFVFSHSKLLDLERGRFLKGISLLS